MAAARDPDTAALAAGGGDRRLELIAAQVPGLVYQFRLHTDGTMSLPYASQGLRRIFGVDPGAVTLDAGAVIATIHADDRERVIASIHESGRTLAPWRQEFRVCAPGDEERWVYGNSTPQREPDGAVSWYGFVTDVTEQRLAAERLAASEATLAAFVVHAPAAVAMFDEDMRYLLWSRRWLVDYGLDGQDLGGRSHHEVLPDQPARWRDVYARALGGAVVRAERDCQVRKDGRVQWLQWEVRPWYTADGRRGGIVVMTEDITSRVNTERALADREAQFRSLVDSIPGVTYRRRCDDALTALFLSASVEALTGHPAQEFVHGRSRHLLDCIHGDDRQAAEQVIRSALERGGSYEVEYRIVRADGTVRWVQERGRATVGHAGRAQHIDGFLLDITDRRESLQRLEEARSLAETASLAKSEFLANTSHEIRTPMTAILGYADLLATDATIASDPALRDEYLERIRANGTHLLALLNDILDLSKIEAGKMTIERVATSPRALLESVLQWMEVRARSKRLELTVEWQGEPPAWISTDPVRLRQILVNLVGNAIKFTNSGAVRLVGTVLGAPPRQQLSIAVSDTGIGMTAEQLKRLFQPFEQADQSTTRRFGGSGLGLRISQRFAEMLGGAIEVESECGRGSTFTVILPIEPTEPAPAMGARPAVGSRPAVGESSAAALSGRRVLVVEDGRDNQVLVRSYLQKAGASVELAEHGQQALEILFGEGGGEGGRGGGAAAPFDLVLLDMQMPVMDGFTTAQRIRSQGLGIPIVALTAHAMASDRQRCLDAGCDDYATKPIDRELLYQACARVLTGD